MVVVEQGAINAYMASNERPLYSFIKNLWLQRWARVHSYISVPHLNTIKSSSY